MGATLEIEESYPTEEALSLVEGWPYEDAQGLFQALADAWLYEDYRGQDAENPALWRFSTGGWSGHEDLIGALQKNRMVWMLCWESSRKGGHYEFRVPESLRRSPVTVPLPNTVGEQP